MERHNFYQQVHKGIRALAGRLVEQAGRTDFRSEDEVRALRRSVEHAFAVFEAHAAHETRFITPLLRVCAPGLAAESDGEHRCQARELDELRGALELAASAGESAPALGHRFVVALSRFEGEMLVHMADEESRLVGALWTAFDDIVLRQVHAGLVDSMPGPEKLDSLRWMLPALNAAERAEMLASVRATAPPPVLAAVRAVVREVLPADEGALGEAALAA